MDQVLHREIHDSLDAFVARIARSVRVLHFQPLKGAPRHVGCCVLIRVGESRFLLTAAHVVTEFLSEPMLLAGDGEFIPVEAHGSRGTQSSATTPESDLIDAGVLRLTKGTRSSLDPYFLELRDLNVREWMSPSPNYLLFGYAASKTQLSPETRTVTLNPFRFAGSVASTPQMKAYGISPQTHVGLGFDIERTVTDKGIARAPSPQGVSGAGIWSLPDIDSSDPGRGAKLAAIFISHPRRHKLLVGSRVFYHLELIRENWPDCASEIPRFIGPSMQFSTA
jgi:hypothetical protein